MIGTAFQIVDDVLDYVGTSDRIGKPIGGDLRQGLFTLPAILYAGTHPSDRVFNNYLTGGEIDMDGVEQVIERILNSEAIEASMDEARTRLERGQRAIETFPPSIYKDSLMELATQVVDRDL